MTRKVMTGSVQRAILVALQHRGELSRAQLRAAVPVAVHDNSIARAMRLLHERKLIEYWDRRGRQPVEPRQGEPIHRVRLGIGVSIEDATRALSNAEHQRRYREKRRRLGVGAELNGGSHASGN
jgi:hypothetical protein